MPRKKDKPSPDEPARPKGSLAKKASPVNKPFFQPFAGLEKLAKKSDEDAKAPSKPAPRPAPPPPVDEPPRSDAETFAMYMAGVKALGVAATRIPATASSVARAPTATAPAEDPDAPARASLRTLVTEGVRFEVSDDGRT